MTTSVHDGKDDYEPDPPELSLLYDDFKREHLTPLWTQLDDLMPMQPAAAGAAARLALGHAVPAGASGPASWSPSAAAASAGRSRWPTRACPAPPTPRRRSGRRSSTSGRTRRPPSTGTARTPSDSSSRARACGPSSTVTRSRCAAAISCSPPAGTSTATTTRPTSPMAWIDGLDIPFVHYTDTGFFEFGSERVTDEATPGRLPLRAALEPPGAPAAVRAAGRAVQLPDRGVPLGAHRPRR